MDDHTAEKLSGQQVAATNNVGKWEMPADGTYRDGQIRNTSSSIAGASSGDFHVYRQERRRELERVEKMFKEQDEKRKDEEWNKDVQARKQAEEDKTRKKATKRKAKKERTKQKQKDRHKKAKSDKPINHDANGDTLKLESASDGDSSKDEKPEANRALK